ncbi:MAG: META domain-containing protein [Chloroflexi bacterium]|nr:META domain-containing protein [Chloroflexota bacterium]
MAATCLWIYQLDSGTMRFVPQGAPIPSPDPEAPAAEADDSTLYLASFGPAAAPQALIEGTRITASFVNETISGFAGCNNYSGTLTAVDDHFTISGIATTFMFCSEPAGVMEQEQAYLAGLETVGGYQWEQNLVGSSLVVTQGQLFLYIARWQRRCNEFHFNAIRFQTFNFSAS